MLPDIYFVYNNSFNDTPYTGTGDSIGDWSSININSLIEYKLIFTGGGILGLLPTPTVASGTRDSTIKPTLDSYVIPQTYIEDATTMYNIPMAGFGGIIYQPYRYVFGLYVSGETTSDIFCECWDDFSFSTTSMEVLQGTPLSGGNSFINAIRTTEAEPPWHPAWTGSDSTASYLRGVENRLRLKNTSYIANEAVYWNMYIRLFPDCSVFFNQPVLSFRYLYS